MIVADNGPQFTAQEFKDFCLRNGIMYRTTAVYKPPINGQAERLVQILKNVLRQAKITGEDPQKLLCRYLLLYRNTPHTTTGETPAMLLLNQNLRMRLDLVMPTPNTAIQKSQEC